MQQIPPQGPYYGPQAGGVPPQQPHYGQAPYAPRYAQGGYAPPYVSPQQGYAPPPQGYVPPYAQQPQYQPPVYVPPVYVPPVYVPPRPKREKMSGDRRRKIIIGCSAAVIALCLTVTLLVPVFLKKLPDVPNFAQGEAPLVQVRELPETEADGIPTPQIAAQVTPSIVNINGYISQSFSAMSSGSGIIMTTDGFIITNAHVVADTTGLEVELTDGTKRVAKVVGIDATTDLAILRIDPEGLTLTPAEFGDSTKMQVGERIVIIGNAAGEFPGSLSQGVVSGLGRKLVFSDGSVQANLIQTDAAINPGNSGGAMVNRFGQVVGIASSKIVDTQMEGLCFAIPIGEAKPVLENLIAYGYVKDRAVLGVSVYALNAFTGPPNGLPSQGLYIDAIQPYSNLQHHDIAPGDILLRAGDTPMLETDDLTQLLKTCKPGDTLRMEFQKGGSGKIITANVLLVEAPQE